MSWSSKVHQYRHAAGTAVVLDLDPVSPHDSTDLDASEYAHYFTAVTCIYMHGKQEKTCSSCGCIACVPRDTSLYLPLRKYTLAIHTAAEWRIAASTNTIDLGRTPEEQSPCVAANVQACVSRLLPNLSRSSLPVKMRHGMSKHLLLICKSWSAVLDPLPASSQSGCREFVVGVAPDGYEP